METEIGRTKCGVRLVLEYTEGTPQPPDSEGHIHTPRIPTAIRLETIDATVRAVKTYREIEADQRRDITTEMAYYVRGGFRVGTREFALGLDMRTNTASRLEVPPLRRAFFTDAQMFLNASRYPAKGEETRKPRPRQDPDGEQVRTR